MKMSSKLLTTTLRGWGLLSQQQPSQCLELNEVEQTSEPDELQSRQLTPMQQRLIVVMERAMSGLTGSNGKRISLPIPIPLSMVRQIVSTAVPKLTDSEIQDYVNLLMDQAEFVLFGEADGLVIGQNGKE